MAIHSSVIWFLNQPKSIYKNTQASASLCPSETCQVKYVSGRLLAKPRVNILTQFPVPKLVINLEMSYIQEICFKLSFCESGVEICRKWNHKINIYEIQWRKFQICIFNRHLAIQDGCHGIFFWFYCFNKSS